MLSNFRKNWKSENNDPDIVARISPTLPCLIFSLESRQPDFWFTLPVALFTKLTIRTLKSRVTAEKNKRPTTARFDHLHQLHFDYLWLSAEKLRCESKLSIVLKILWKISRKLKASLNKYRFFFLWLWPFCCGHTNSSEL